MLNPPPPVGGLLRQWRQRRRLSQLDLACDAGISTRHLSFLETGRAQPSRDMVLLLSEQLDVPIRERNVLLVAAGFAPDLSRTGSRRSGAGAGARRNRSGAGSAEALPGFRARSPLADCRQQCGAARIVRGRSVRTHATAGQCLAPFAPSARAGAPHCQPRRVARASPVPVASSGRANSRCGVDRTVARSECLSRRIAPAGADVAP